MAVTLMALVLESRNCVKRDRLRRQFLGRVNVPQTKPPTHDKPTCSQYEYVEPSCMCWHEPSRLLVLLYKIFVDFSLKSECFCYFDTAFNCRFIRDNALRVFGKRFSCCFSNYNNFVFFFESVVFKITFDT